MILLSTMVNCVKCQTTLQMFEVRIHQTWTKDHNKYPAKKNKSLLRKLDQIISKIRMDFLFIFG